MNYAAFLQGKSQSGEMSGFDPVFMPEFLFDFQRALVDWAVRKGRCAVFADCGLGKTPMQLVWAQNVVEHTNKPVLIVTPLAVSAQTCREGDKFGMECHQSREGKVFPNITVTNYERLHYFNPEDFAGVVCDESSILKNFDGKRKAIVTEFLRTRPYRLLCTATAAPNDYIELGTTSEALGQMGHMDMLARFFKNDQNTCDTKSKWRDTGGGRPQWRFKHHAEHPFWQWVCSFARALRRPSDMGFDDTDFILPPLIERETVLVNTEPPPGELFPRVAIGLFEQRQEARQTIQTRCEAVANCVNGHNPALVWCHLIPEGKLLTKLIPGAVEISGSDSDEKKEEKFLAFASGQARVLVTKPKIGGFGLNFQHCAHVTFFPSHSFEQYYQGTRRCWRFGQTNPVVVDVITTEGELDVLKNLQRKAAQADEMFTHLVGYMNDAIGIDKSVKYETKEVLPSWLS